MERNKVFINGEKQFKIHSQKNPGPEIVKKQIKRNSMSLKSANRKHMVASERMEKVK